MKEEWKPAGTSGIYEVSNIGNVRNIIRDTIVKAPVNNRGYERVRIDGKLQSVHVLVLEAFCSKRPDGMICRHLDGNKLNNRIDNLKWGTSKENSQDDIKNGVTRRGTQVAKCKLSESDVRKIRALKADGMGCSAIARMFNVGESAIRKIITGERWYWLK